ncbi:MAG: hypothetical protein WDN75_18695 [Bacteroidota bacterium]
MNLTRALVIFLLVFPLILCGQDFNKTLQEAIDASDKGDYKRSIEISESLYDLYPRQ